ncbi:phenylacetate--CoA ligase family protein [Marinobacter sp. SS21]|uniref:phenylacetate--CoA ligase family protein n=1 Tax=Marinobacter sp. SS21 TaxID=2979460 RepID=UPI00232CD889|nr:hypothetical protein [Marinobacter sp. SS21]MDC0661945.1 hypothetical protein [Marinobacter sp. SS21]
MNSAASKFLLYYPSTLLKGEPIPWLIGEYLANQHASKQELEALQLRRFQAILDYALTRSEFYRQLYGRAGMQPHNLQSLSALAELPTIEKLDLIDHLEQISPKRNGLTRSTKTTGGSTGQPVRLYKNPMALARERCATWRSYGWAGVGVGDAQLRFWGVPHAKGSELKAKLTDLIANRKRISAFNLTEQSLEAYYREAIRFKPRYLYGYVSVIDQFAKYVIDNRLPPIPGVQSVITTSEILNSSARATIERAFGVKVFNEYGCGEVGSVAHECRAGNMHLMADNLMVQVDAPHGQAGEIIVTDFFNLATPLIRYRLGDFGTLSDKQCECGVGLPLIEAIHGRAYDILETPSGRRVHPEAIIYTFETLQTKTNAFKQFQVIQLSPFNISINIIANTSWSDEVKQALLEGLRSDIGKDIDYRLNFVNEISREKSGKMRLVKRAF